MRLLIHEVWVFASLARRRLVLTENYPRGMVAVCLILDAVVLVGPLYTD